MKQFITRAVGAVKLAAKAHAPAIMVTSGVVAMSAGTVVACKQTLKVEEKLKDRVLELEMIDSALDSHVINNKEAQSDRLKVYVRAGKSMVVLYAVPGALFVGGVGLVFGGHRLLVRRNATLAVSLAALGEAFDAYRARVRAQWGPEAEAAMMQGYTLEQVRDPETGEVTGTRAVIEASSGLDPYNRVFEEGVSSEWMPDLGANKLFIANQQRMANILLSNRGHLYLSDVYKALGFEETPISRVAGWKVTRLPDGSRDIPFVDFGIDKRQDDDWVYNKNNAIYLDFNCQGYIIGGDVQKILERG